jgi:hypothetical protein
MARFLLNPTFDIETGRLLSHDGESFEEPTILFDRGAVAQAKQQGATAGGVAGAAGSDASKIGSTITPILTQQAEHPTGYDPTTLNNMLVSQQEAVGGGNAAIGGEGRLSALRTRSAGGLAPVLAEAARSKGRTLASGAQAVQNESARLAQEKQQQALSRLQGLYGTDTSNQLRAMGLQAEDLQDQLAAGKQGWLQNTEGILGTIGNLGSSAAGVKKAFG